MAIRKKVIKGKVYYALYDGNKFVKHIGNAAKLKTYKDEVEKGTKLSEILEKRPDLVSTLGTTPIRAFEADRDSKLKRVTIPIPIADVYYADPPWRYNFSRVNAWAVEVHYPTMALEKIIALKKKMITPPDCILFLWSPSPKLADALQVMAGWGFEYKVNIIWDKVVAGMGYWCMQQHETLLVGTKGNFPLLDTYDRFPSVITEKKTRHSRKPMQIYDLIEAMFPNMRYTEMFAREKHSDKWQVWGNELPDDL
jgi:N6-adenosine-specific RNA methylase IME4